MLGNWGFGQGPVQPQILDLTSTTVQSPPKQTMSVSEFRAELNANDTETRLERYMQTQSPNSQINANQGFVSQGWDMFSQQNINQGMSTPQNMSQTGFGSPQAAPVTRNMNEMQQNASISQEPHAVSDPDFAFEMASLQRQEQAKRLRAAGEACEFGEEQYCQVRKQLEGTMQLAFFLCLLVN